MRPGDSIPREEKGFCHAWSIHCCACERHHCQTSWNIVFGEDYRWIFVWYSDVAEVETSKKTHRRTGGEEIAPNVPLFRMSSKLCYEAKSYRKEMKRFLKLSQIFLHRDPCLHLAFIGSYFRRRDKQSSG